MILISVKGFQPKRRFTAELTSIVGVSPQIFPRQEDAIEPKRIEIRGGRNPRESVDRMHWRITSAKLLPASDKNPSCVMVLIVCLLPMWLTLRDVVGCPMGAVLSFGIRHRSQP